MAQSVYSTNKIHRVRIRYIKRKDLAKSPMTKTLRGLWVVEVWSPVVNSWIAQGEWKTKKAALDDMKRWG